MDLGTRHSANGRDYSRPYSTRRRCRGACQRALAAVLLLTTTVAGVAAQVGHDPAKSPYEDLRNSQFITATGGYMLGKGGILGIGPHHGRVITLRHDFLGERPLSIALGGGLARLERNFLDTAAANYGLRGPIEHNVWFAEGTAQLNVTGGKTWHNLAPYLSMGIGLAFAEKVPQDSSGYRFGTKFYIAPAAGARVFLTRRLYLRLEARAQFWNLSYPATYRTTDPDGPFGPIQPILFGEALKEWSPVPMLHAGLGYAFRRPFF